MKKIEKEILELLKAGVKNKDIAVKLNVADSLIPYYKKKHGIKRQTRVIHTPKLEKRIKLSGLTRDETIAAGIKLSRKKQNCKKTLHEFNVSFEDVIWNSYCPILGIKLDYFSEGISPNSPSFDRIDNSKGYVKGNVIVISYRANMLKSDGTIEEFTKIIEFIKKYDK